MLGSTLAVSTIDQHRAAPGRRAGVDIAPAIADQETAAEVDPMALRPLDQQPRFWLTAPAAIRVIVPADKETVHAQRGANRDVDGFHGRALRGAARDVRLVGHRSEERRVGK